MLQFNLLDCSLGMPLLYIVIIRYKICKYFIFEILILFSYSFFFGFLKLSIVVQVQAIDFIYIYIKAVSLKREKKIHKIYA